MKFTRGRLILIAILVALFAAYTLFGFLGVPRLLHSKATEFVASEYGRKIDIGEIQFNPFTLVLKVHGLSFPDSEGQPLVGFRELLVDSMLRRCSAWRPVSRPSNSPSRSRA